MSGLVIVYDMWPGKELGLFLQPIGCTGLNN